MSDRNRLANLSALKNGYDPTGLRLEIAGEMASALGAQGKRAADALAELRAATGEVRELKLDRAAYAIWAFFIQRELCGMRNHRAIIAELCVPDEVLRRMGSAATLKS
ncbi:MAG: hypothetical protein H6873_03770 [Hyphomicrobiaceae bacterium]|nr:hypothetical protein [Hyphomicrobiaceae bacterium]